MTTVADFVSSSGPELLLAIRAKALRESFGLFVREAWHHATGYPYIHGPHVDVLVRHLEAVARGGISRLLVNVPPATFKSTIASVLFPAWVWTWDQSADFLCFSYSAAIGLDFSTRTRELLRQPWYQALFPSVQIAIDDDQKQFYRLTAGGWRRTSTIGGTAMGAHPRYIIIDDPISRDEVVSPQIREQVRTWYFETLSTRGIGKRSSHVVVQQRLHPDDLSGAILTHSRQLVADHGSTPWHHVSLPMRFDLDRAMIDRGFGGDWRTERGQLLYPEVLSEETVQTVERSVGPAGTSAQLQQNPQRRDSGMFRVDRLRTITSSQLPSRFDSVVRFFDLASTSGGGDYTSSILMGLVRDGHRLQVFILDITRDQLGPDGVIDTMLVLAFIDQTRFGDSVRLGWESQPSAAGKFLNDQLSRRLRSFRTFNLPSTKAKSVRAEAFATSVGLGEVSIVEGPNVSAFIAELETFPGGRHDDMVDAASGAYQSLLDRTTTSSSIVLAEGSEHRPGAYSPRWERLPRGQNARSFLS
jgi:predicted phage terminase large subunit-like protein